MGCPQQEIQVISNQKGFSSFRLSLWKQPQLCLCVAALKKNMEKKKEWKMCFFLKVTWLLTLFILLWTLKDEADISPVSFGGLRGIGWRKIRSRLSRSQNFTKKQDNVSVKLITEIKVIQSSHYTWNNSWNQAGEVGSHNFQGLSSCSHRELGVPLKKSFYSQW